MTGITHHQIAADRRHVMALVAAAAAVAAVVALVLVLAWTDGGSAPTAAPAVDEPQVQTFEVMPNAPRYDGGPEEGSRGPGVLAAPNPGRPDGGPDEGTVGPGH